MQSNNQVTSQSSSSWRGKSCKWILTAVLSLFLLALITCSKVSIMVLSKRLADQVNTTKESTVILFVMLEMMILIPNIVTLFRSIIKCYFRRDIPSPAKWEYFLAFAISLSESCGLTLFVFIWPRYITPSMCIALMGCITTPITMCYILAKVSDVIRVLLSVLVLVFTVCLTVFPEILNHTRIPGNGIAYFTLTAVFLLFAWMPQMQSKLLDGYVKKDETSENEEGNNQEDVHMTANEEGNNQEDILMTENEEGNNQEDIHMTANEEGNNQEDILMTENEEGNNQEDILMTENEEGNNQEDVHRTERVKTSLWEMFFSIESFPIDKKQTTWKITLFMSFWKIVFVHLISMGIFYYTPPHGLRNYDSAFKLSLWKHLDRRQLLYFSSNIICSFLGYMLYFFANTVQLKFRWHAIPLCLSSLMSCVLLLPEVLGNYIFVDEGTNNFTKLNVYFTSGAAIVVTAIYVIDKLREEKENEKENLILREYQLFWIPTYNSVLLDQWLLLCERRPGTRKSNLAENAPVNHRPKVFICTTMYQESKEEMEQLLNSFKALNHKEKKEYDCEINIFFDDACGKENTFVDQLTKLVNNIFNKEPEQIETAYGHTLVWESELQIHMKDNKKVKNKKRWSQVMYMSYVLEFRQKGKLNNCYILATDADVDFTPESVDSLLDMMKRDENVGAVCARTHPLGSGPIVWYQIFEYAIGHWLQKTAEHVIGTVLCAPGCFSLYRCTALEQVLDKYKGKVGNAFDFLTMDMGEDRWLCTLMVQSGRRIDYCAKADCKTYCPDTFEEFFKQRRRWILSTLANHMLLLKEWQKIKKENKRIGTIFWLYEVLTLVSTVVGPSSVILVVSGGLVYAWGVPTTWSTIIQILLIVIYAVVSLRASQTTQMIMANFLTYLYSVTMCAVMVGILIEIVQDVIGTNTDVIDRRFRLSSSTLYLFIMVGFFLLTGIMHLWKEFRYLLYGFCYFLAIPAGYLVLMVYGLCNITDRSWGTRESATKNNESNKTENESSCSGMLQELCRCPCVWRTRTEREIIKLVDGVSQTDPAELSDNSLRSVESLISQESHALQGSQELPRSHESHELQGSQELPRSHESHELLGSQELPRSHESHELQGSQELLRSPRSQELQGSQESPTSLNSQELEALFWSKLQQEIKPEEDTTNLQGKLVSLRNTWLLLFSFSNSLWMILIISMANNAQLLKVVGSNPIGLVVLTIFLIVLTLQFLAMLRHRLGTLVHYIARKNRALDESATRDNETPEHSTTRENETPEHSTTRENETPEHSTTRENETPEHLTTRENETPEHSTTRENETPEHSTTRENGTPNDLMTIEDETPDDSGFCCFSQSKYIRMK